MSVLPELQYTYTQDENLETLINSIKANNACKEQRKVFNLCRSTVLGRHVQPQQCLEQSLDLVNCFQKVRRNESANCQNAFNQVFQCAQRMSTDTVPLGSCQSMLDAYINCV